MWFTQSCTPVLKLPMRRANCPPDLAVTVAAPLRIGVGPESRLAASLIAAVEGGLGDAPDGYPPRVGLGNRVPPSG